MIIELLLAPIFELIKIIVDLIPAFPALPSFMTQTRDLLAFPLSFFPNDLWTVLFVNIMAWVTIHSSWSIIEWGYKKIPGID